MTLKTTRFDIADELDDEAAIALYLDDALEANDPAYFAHALGTVARARGMSQIASEAGLNRGSLYAALGPDGNPTLSTLMQVMKALGLRLKASTIGAGTVR